MPVTKLTHGHTAGGQSPTYRSYRHAKKRCSVPSDRNYYLYGGRGIEFRFASFQEFLAEVGERPSLDHSIDRINSNGHYEAGNVKWSTRQEQARNTSQARWLTIDGETECVAEWATRTSVRSVTIRGRLRVGWCHKCSVFNPPGQWCSHVKRNAMFAGRLFNPLQ